MCSLQAEHTLLPVDRVSFALVNWRHNFLVSASLLWAPTAVHSTPSRHRPKRMLPKQVAHTKRQNDHSSISFVSIRLALAASGRTGEVGTVAIAGRRGQSP